MTHRKRKEILIRRLGKVMGWKFQTSPVLTVLRKVLTGEAVAIGLDKLEEVIKSLEGSMSDKPKREGWAWLDNTTKRHYFVDGRSLCCKWGYFGELTPGTDYYPQNCTVCRKKLYKLKEAKP